MVQRMAIVGIVVAVVASSCSADVQGSESSFGETHATASTSTRPGQPTTTTTVRQSTTTLQPTTTTTVRQSTTTTLTAAEAVRSLSAVLLDVMPTDNQESQCIAELLIEETGPAGHQAWKAWLLAPIFDPMISTQGSAEAFADAMIMCFGSYNLKVLFFSSGPGGTAMGECVAEHISDDMIGTYLMATVLEPELNGFTDELQEAAMAGMDRCT